MGYEEQDPFDVVIFGYKKAQVDAFIDEFEAHSRVCRAESGMLPAAQADLLAAHAEIVRLKTSVERLRDDMTLNQPTVAASQRILQMFRLAEQEAAAIRGQADAILKEAMARAEQITRQAREDAALAAAQRREALIRSGESETGVSVVGSVNGAHRAV